MTESKLPITPTPGTFADRLRPETYTDDIEWMVGVVRTGQPVDWASSVPQTQAMLPERIAERLLDLGRAYRLHVLQQLSPSKQNRLNAQQARGLADEICFLLSAIEDPALREHVTVLERLAHECSTRPGTELIVEGP